MTNNTNKWDKLLGILLSLAVFLGLIYLSYSNRQKAEEFGKVIEKHYNVSIPSNLVTKKRELTWFCSYYKFTSQECKLVDNIVFEWDCKALNLDSEACRNKNGTYLLNKWLKNQRFQNGNPYQVMQELADELYQLLAKYKH